MEKNWSLDESARSRMVDEVTSNGKILEVGPLCNPLFIKEEHNVFYADIKDTDAVKNRYQHLPKKLFEKIVDIDYVICDSYYNTFNDDGVKFDYVVSSHVFEHIPDPIGYLLDISTILNDNGKVCMLMPDKDFTLDHYRENSSFADMYDMYVRGESNNTPRLFLDFEFDRVEENNFKKYWNKTFSDYPNPNTGYILKEYENYINNFTGKSFDSHYWVFTDRSFLRILENFIKSNILPYKIVSFFPTAYNDNTFGVILELDYTIKFDSKLRKQQINDIREISKNIEKKRFEINAKSIIQENNRLKETIEYIMNILKENKITVGNTVFLLPEGFHRIESNFGVKITNGTCSLIIFKYDDNDLSKYVDEYKKCKSEENVEVDMRYFTIDDTYVCKSTLPNNPYLVHYWFILNQKVYSIYSEDASKNIDVIVSKLISSSRQLE